MDQKTKVEVVKVALEALEAEGVVAEGKPSELVSTCGLPPPPRTCKGSSKNIVASANHF